MISRKTLAIWGATLVVATIGGALLVNNNSTPTITEASLLEQYQQLQKDAQQQAAQDCDDPKAFSKQTKNLEDRFDKLRQQKHDLIAEMNTDEWIPDLPPLPGEEAPTDIGPSETSDTTEQEEYIPRPGELPLDLDGNSTPVEEAEYIPPIPGSEAPADIGPSETEPETDTDEYIPPLPWSEPLDFDEGAITTMQRIQNIEVDIKDILEALQTKCEEKPSNDCEKACRNYNSKCLSLVPNVNQTMLNDGFSSCMQQCKKRSKEKVQCMEDAKDCVAMTDICGL